MGHWPPTHARQSLHPKSHTGNARAHRYYQIAHGSVDGLPTHSALGLHLTKSPLATCHAQATALYASLTPHQVRGHLQAQAWRLTNPLPPRHESTQSDCYLHLAGFLPSPNSGQWLLDSGVPSRHCHVALTQNPSLHQAHHYPPNLPRHRPSRFAWQDRLTQSANRLAESDFFPPNCVWYYRNHRQS